MKPLHLFLILSLVYSYSAAQKKDFKRQLKNLYKVKSMPYVPELSGDEFFWDAVKGKIEIVPYLIEMIPNDKKTKAHVPYFGGYYAVGDVAYDVITEIIRDMPTLDIIKHKGQFDENSGYGNYW